MSAFEKTSQHIHLPVLHRPKLRAEDRAPAARSSSNFPAALSFLSAHGIDPNQLLQAAFLGLVEGVRPEAAMMAHGMITDDDYYRALARQLGVPFMDGEVELSSLSGFPHSIMTGVAGLRVDGSGSIPWLYAPRGAQIDHWLAVRRGAIPLRNFAITTPRRLAALVTRHCGAEAADRASEGLMRQNGEAASARSWTPRRLAPGLCGLVCLYGALWLAGGVFALALSSIVALALVAFIGLRLMALAASCDAEPFPQREALRPPDLPLYTVIVALYREAGVVAQLTAALDALDYPRSRLDIKLVVEDTDTATRTALENRALPACYEIVVAPEGQPRTKPRALNIALDRARGKLVCVFDAEDIPERGQLREAAERFAALPSYVACLQGRLAIDNGADSWIAKCFALEYAALFDVINPGLAALDVPIPLGGTSNHFRSIMHKTHLNKFEEKCLLWKLFLYGRAAYNLYIEHQTSRT